jgi:hypothetical protein
MRNAAQRQRYVVEKIEQERRVGRGRGVHRRRQQVRAW